MKKGVVILRTLVSTLQTSLLLVAHSQVFSPYNFLGIKMTTEEETSTSYMPHNGELNDTEWISVCTKKTALLEIIIYGYPRPPSSQKTPLLRSLLYRLKSLHYQVDLISLPIRLLANQPFFLPPFSIEEMDDEAPLIMKSRRKDVDDYLVLAQWKIMRLRKKIVKKEIEEFGDNARAGSMLHRFTDLFDKFVDEMDKEKDSKEEGTYEMNKDD